MRRTAMCMALPIAATVFAACGNTHPAPAAHAREPIAVTVVPVSSIDTAHWLDAGGVVAAEEAATISSRVVATIAGVRVKAGDRVRAGDVLVTLDARDVLEHARQARAGALAAEKALAQARSELTSAEAEHRLATASHQRIGTLHARKSATDQERDETEARLTAATAHAAGAQAGIELAEANLAAARSALGAAAAAESYTAVRAPFDGLVTERLTDPGNLAAPGVPLLRVEADGARQVVVRVDEARAAYVTQGAHVDVLIGESAADSAAAPPPVEGVVAEVAQAVGPDQRAFTVKVTIPRTVTARSGTFARIVFRGRPYRTLLIPTTAIQRQGQVSSVYIVKDHVARLRLVHAGVSAAAGTEIVAGLDAGESIVVSPSRDLTDGARVAVRAAPLLPGGTP